MESGVLRRPMYILGFMYLSFQSQIVSTPRNSSFGVSPSLHRHCHPPKRRTRGDVVEARRRRPMGVEWARMRIMASFTLFRSAERSITLRCFYVYIRIDDSQRRPQTSVTTSAYHRRIIEAIVTMRMGEKSRRVCRIAMI